MYINDFQSIINKFSHTIIFANNTNILASSSDLTELNSTLNSVLRCISECFQNNQLILKLHKTYMQKNLLPLRSSLTHCILHITSELLLSLEI